VAFDDHGFERAANDATGLWTNIAQHIGDSQMQLIADLGEKVIRPAELKVLDLQRST